jgi:hypothetical protein
VVVLRLVFVLCVPCYCVVSAVGGWLLRVPHLFTVLFERCLTVPFLVATTYSLAGVDLCPPVPGSVTHLRLSGHRCCWMEFAAASGFPWWCGVQSKLWNSLWAGMGPIELLVQSTIEGGGEEVVVNEGFSSFFFVSTARSVVWDSVQGDFWAWLAQGVKEHWKHTSHPTLSFLFQTRY